MTETQKILIVDDRPENLVALRHVLSHLDVEVVEASSGNEALTRTLSHDFSLAIFDVQMPGMDGYELAELVRGDPKTANLPVIFLTAAYGEAVQVFKGYEAGAVDYIVKPYDSAVLLAKVRVFLELHQAQKALGRRLFELAVSKERYQTLVATIPDIVYRIDTEGRFTFLNNAVVSLGYQPEELIGLPFTQIIHPADVENACARYVLPRYADKCTGDKEAPGLFDERRTGPRQTLSMEVRLLSQRTEKPVPAELNSGGAAVVVVEVSSSGLYSATEGRSPIFLGTVGVIRDVSERKEAESELSRYRRHLEALVQDRTAELTQANESLQQEISERRRAEAALAREKAELQATLYGIGEAVIATDAEGRVARMNPVAEQLTGWTEAEAVHRPLEEVFVILDEETRRQVQISVGSTLGTGFGDWLAGQALLVARDGSEVPIAEAGAPIFDAEGQPIGVVLVFRDQAEERLTRRLIEKRLALIEYAAEHTLDAFLTRALDDVETSSASSIGFFYVVAPGRKDVISHYWSSNTMLESGGQASLEDIDAARVWEDCVATKQAVIENNYAERLYMKGMPGGGVEITREMVVPVTREDRVVAIFGVGNKSEDYTEKDIEVVAWFADVTWEIHQRKKAEEQFRQSQKLESIGRLAGGVAHDFNNMLSVIIGYSEELLENLDTSDSLRDAAQEILMAGRHSATLTRQLLAFSRKQPLQPEVLDINQIVRDLEKMLHRLIGEDIQLTTVLADDLACVEVDPGQIEQVIMNLAVNARDAMPRGGKLTIETTGVTLDDARSTSHVSIVPGKYVLLAMTDTGCGMEAEVQAHLFEPFFTTKEKGKGTGLGLSTVYGIVKQSGGYIWVYSEPGQGTTFKVYLPQSQTEPGLKEDPVDVDMMLLKGAAILVVEDDPSLQKLIQLKLDGLGCKVSVAGNGEEALEMVQEHGLRPELLLTDVVMPGISGDVLAERLCSLLPELKVLFMSGYTDNTVIHLGSMKQGTPFIQKPFNLRDLKARIASLLTQDRKV